MPNNVIHFEYFENLKKCFVSLPLDCTDSVKIEIERTKMVLNSSSGKKEFLLDSNFYFEPNSCRMDQNQAQNRNSGEEGWMSFSISLGNKRCGVKHEPERLGDFLEKSIRQEKDIDLINIQNLNQFSCLTCQSKFISDFQASKALHLPSDYWYEMTECWACHHEDYTTLPGQIGGTIIAQENALLSGISYYLMHPKHVDLEKILIRLTGREVKKHLNIYTTAYTILIQL